MTESLSKPEPIVPAYRRPREDGGMSIVFHCPYCKVVHSHGLPPDEITHSRASHCTRPDSPLYGRGYRLVPVGFGELPSPRSSPPRLPRADLDALNAAAVAR